MKKLERLRGYIVLHCDYIEHNVHGKNWEEQKKWLYEKYKLKYPEYDIKIIRSKTDTKYLRAYTIWGKKEGE